MVGRQAGRRSRAPAIRCSSCTIAIARRLDAGAARWRRQRAISRFATSEPPRGRRDRRDRRETVPRGCSASLQPVVRRRVVHPRRSPCALSRPTAARSTGRRSAWGLEPAGRLRAHRAEDADRPARVRDARRRHQQAARLRRRRRRRSCSARSATASVWGRVMTGALGPEARSTASSSRSRCCRRSSSSPRSSPSSITSASCRSSCALFAVVMHRVMRRERRRVAERRRQHLHGADRSAADDPAVPAGDDRSRS